MKFEFEKPKGCQSCPCCFIPEDDYTFYPCCRLKEIRRMEDISCEATFGTEESVDENCPVINKVNEKNIEYMEKKVKDLQKMSIVKLKMEI